MNSAKTPLIVTACLYLVFTYLHLEEYKWDPSQLVQAGDFFANPKKTPKSLQIISNSLGYDGQFYYRLALKPFSGKKTDFGITFDDPPWRQKRILYPLLTYLFTFGYPPLVPYVMIIINLAALSLIGWMGGKFAIKAGMHALWGLTFPLYAGFVVTLVRDLAEIVEISLLMAVLLLIRQGRQVAATIFLTLAVFAKEPSLLVVWAIFLAFLAGIRKREKSLRWYLFLIPGVSHVIWHVSLYYRWSVSLSSDISDKLDIPFAAMLSFFIKNFPLKERANPFCFIEICVILLLIGAIAFSFRTSKANLVEKIAWIHYFILVVSMTESHYWIVDYGFLRVLAEFFMTGSIVLIFSDFKLKKPAILLGIAFWLFIAITVHYYPDLNRFSSEELTKQAPVKASMERIVFRLKIEPDQNYFKAGERLRLFVDAEYPSGTVTAVDFYFVLHHHESGSTTFAQSFGENPQPAARSVSIYPGFLIEGARILDILLPSDLPPARIPGTYTFAAAAFNTDSRILISNVASASFELR